MLSDHAPFLLVVSAPSGCGKTTLLKKLFKKIEGLAISVSHTTREPRVNEVDGVDYHFVDSKLFLKMENNGQFIESATVHCNSYGTSSSSIEQQLEAGLDVVLDIDVQGMKEVKQNSRFDMVSVFIMPPSMAELESRLRSRQTDSDPVIRQRLENATVEISNSHLYDYVILNDCIDVACKKLTAIVLAERSRSSRAHLLTNS